MPFLIVAALAVGAWMLIQKVVPGLKAPPSTTPPAPTGPPPPPPATSGAGKNW